MDYLHIATQMLMIFGIVVVGYLSAKRNLWAPELNRKMSVFVLNVSAPCLILASVMGKGLVFERMEIMQIMLVSVLNYVILIGGAYLVTAIWRMEPDRRGQLRFMLSFGNVTFIGFPVLAAIFGDRAVFYGAVLTIPFNILIFTVGIEFIRGGAHIWKAFRPRLIFSPCVVASVAAVAMALMKVETPAPVAQWFHLLGDMTIPCALIIIGASLTAVPVRAMAGNRFVYTMAALKLGVLPVAVLTLFRLLGMEEYVTSVAVVLSAMPVAANGIMFCLKYGKEERNMAQGIFITTLLSVATIPLIAMLC